VSLRTRLLVGLAVLVLLAVATSGWMLLTVARIKLTGAQEVQARLLGEQAVRVLAMSFDASRPLSSADNRALLEGTARALVDRGDVAEVAMIDADGKPVVGTPGDDWALTSALKGTLFIVRRSPAIYVFSPIAGGSQVAGAVRLRVPGEDVLGRALSSAWLLLIAVTLFDGVLVLAFGWMFIQRVVGPIAALSQAARRVADGALDIPPVTAPTRDDELGDLTQAFNRMTASLREQRETLVAHEKLATVGRLAAGVAHEVGNPLAAVLGYSDLLIPDEKDPERRDMLERIRKETERIRVIIADLLDYSKPVAGAVEPVRLGDAVDAAVTLLRPQSRFRDVVVHNEVPADLPEVSASTSRIIQVLVNLLLNAADAMQGTGTITVGGRAEDGTVTLSLRDSGPGVPAGDRDKVFDPFFTTKDPGQGTGLGLSVSRAIAQAYGGDLTLAPSASGGATFVVTLKRWTTPSLGRSAG
jgi:two-component system, NtrC family, sensor kinase